MNSELDQQNFPDRNAMLWRRADQFTLSILTQMGQAAVQGRDLSRREVAGHKMAVWKNAWQSLLDEQLRGMFTPENYANLLLFPHTATNVLERVIREICMLCQEPATRYLKGSVEDEDGDRMTAGGRLFDLIQNDDEQLIIDEAAPAAENGVSGAAATATPSPGAAPSADATEDALEAEAPVDDDTPFDRWLAAVDLDALVADAQRLAHFNDVFWVMPVVDQNESGEWELSHHYYTPANADVIPDPHDATRAVAFYTWRFEQVDKKGQPIDNSNLAALVNEKREFKMFFYVWTKTEFGKFDDHWQPVALQDAANAVNKLGELPIVAVRVGNPLDSYFLDGIGNDLYDATIEVGVLRTIQNARFRDSGFKQLVITGDPEKIPANQVFCPGSPIYLGEQHDSATILDLQANLAEMSKVVQERLENIHTKYGISPAQWSMTEKAQSGFSKKMDQAKIVALNRADRKHFARFEADLYRLDAKMLAAYPVKTIGQLDAEANYVVEYADPKFEEEPLVQARADAIDLRLNKTNVLELIMRDNPDLTEEEALRRLALNRAINKRFLDPDETTLLDLLAEGARRGAGGGGGGAQGNESGAAAAGGGGR